MIGIGLGMAARGARSFDKYALDGRHPVLLLDVERGVCADAGRSGKAAADLLTVARAGTAIYRDERGTLRTAAENEARFDWSSGRRALLLEASSTNLLSCYTNPTDTTGWGAGSSDGAGVFSVVEDADALAAAGLDGIVTGGMVYKADNSAGTADLFVNSSVICGAVGEVALSLYYRGGGDECSVYLTGQSSDRTLLDASGYLRAEKVSTATLTTQRMVIRVRPGYIVYFTMAQMELSDHVSSYIPVEGGAATRAADLAGEIDLSGHDLSAGYTAYVAANVGAVAGTYDRVFQIDGGDDTGRTHVFYDTARGGVSASMYSDSDNQITSTRVAVALGDDFTAALARGPDHGQFVINDTVSELDEDADYPAQTVLRLGSSAGGNRPAVVRIYDFRLYATLAAAAQMEAIAA